MDPDLHKAAELLGIKLYEPRLPSPRVPRIQDGQACLVFKSEATRRAHVAQCQSEVQSRCVSGARYSCSIQALDACQGPALFRGIRRWLSGPRSVEDTRDCEERHMKACLATAERECREHAGSFCEEALPMQVCEPVQSADTGTHGANRP